MSGKYFDLQPRQIQDFSPKTSKLKKNDLVTIPALKARMPTGPSTTSGAASAPATSWVSCSGPWGKSLICHSSNHHRYCPHNHRCLFQTHLSPGQGCLQELPDLASRRRREKREKVSFSYYDGRGISLQVTKYVTTSKPPDTYKLTGK